MNAAAEDIAQDIAIDISIESPLWDDSDCETTVRRAVAAAAPKKAQGELSVLLTDDAAIRVLNAQWRNKDEPTNVLSFPAPKVSGAGPRPLGDIVIAYETTAREAAAEHKTLDHHLAHLT